jgi:hypothetical protein
MSQPHNQQTQHPYTPPVTIPQYLTAGLLLLLINIVFVVVSNEADVFSSNNVVIYNPFAILSFADQQKKINKEEFNVQVIDTITTPKTEKKALHLLVIDHTTPNLDKTVFAKNFTDLDSIVSKKLCAGSDEFDKDLNAFLKKKTMVQKVAVYTIGSYYFKEDSIRKDKGFALLHYLGDRKGCVSKFKYENNYNLVQKINHSGSNPKKDYMESIKSIFAVDLSIKSNTRTDLSTLFKEISDFLEQCKENNNAFCNAEITIDFLSDFAHEGKFRNEKNIPNSTVVQAVTNFINKHDKIKQVNLVVFPCDQGNVDAKENRNSYLLKSIITKIDNPDKVSVQQVMVENYVTSTELIPNVDATLRHNLTAATNRINFYYPFRSGGNPNTAKCNIKFDKPNIIRLVPLNGQLLDDVIEVEISNKSKSLSMANFTTITDSNSILKLVANSQQDLATISDIGLSYEKDGVNYTVPISFIKKITILEADILAFSLYMIIVGFMIWIILMFIAKIHLHLPMPNNSNDWLDRKVWAYFKNQYQNHKDRLLGFCTLIPIILGLVVILQYEFYVKQGIIWSLMTLLITISLVFLHERQLRRSY